MHRMTPLLGLLIIAGCGHHYRVVGESDTSDPISVSIMKVASGGEPKQIYYTELTGDGTEFVFDERVPGQDARVEAWFEIRGRSGRPTVYTLPPDQGIRVKLDTDDGAVVVEETKPETNEIDLDDLD